MADKDKEVKKMGRPKKVVPEKTVVDEENNEILAMAKEKERQERITLQNLDAAWRSVAGSLLQIDKSGKVSSSEMSTLYNSWNDLNPFLQNDRIKKIYTQAHNYAKNDISEFLKDPANSEEGIRGAAWLNSSTQQIYYNILRRSADIPLYNYFKIPEYDPDPSKYKSKEFEREDKLSDQWLDTFDIPNTLKTMALEVKREGKSSYILRNKYIKDSNGKPTEVSYCTLQKLPTNWVKITGKGELGFTISFNMMYFLQPGNNPAHYGDFMINAWNDITNKKIFIVDEKTKKYNIDLEKAAQYSFSYLGESYSSFIETRMDSKTKTKTYMFWLKVPYDICYTFGSDNSNPWVIPDTAGLLQSLQELSDYGQLAGLIASTPLSAVLTGEVETIPNPRSGQNESVFSPEIIQGMMDRFNAVTSTNIEAWFFPAKNIKLQQLASDVNASEIMSTATENFVQKAGESGLTITTDKPNIGQITVAKQLAASQQRYVTLQFNKVINFILKNKLGFNFEWRIVIWGDIFSIEAEKKYLKEVVASGNITLLPKLLSAEGIKLRDAKALNSYIESFEIYKDYKTYSQEARQSAELEKVAQGQSTQGAGRPSLSDDEVENDSTGASKVAGTNTSDNREQMEKDDTICPICGGVKQPEEICCPECKERILEEEGY